ncbi:MAG TPA: imelysin family protein [Polyangiaceae bacterium]|nr:imelysin family protein [Polyangiaceae bacterium]
MARGHRKISAISLLCAAALVSCEKSVQEEQVRPRARLLAPGNAGSPASSAGSAGTNGVQAGGGDSELPDGGIVDGGEDPNASAGGNGNPGSGGSAQGGSTSQAGGTGGITGFAGSTSNAGSSGEGGSAGSTSPPPEPDFSKPGLLTALADCATASYTEFKGLAQAFSEATADLVADDRAANQAAAENAWRAAMASWQRAEPFRFGPAARSMDPGGQNLRDQIYIFNLVNNCMVDQRIVDQGYNSISSVGASARGLSAAEYLLFYTGSNNACVPEAAINANGTWAALSAGELRARRIEYVRRVGQDLSTRATTLVNAWHPDQGNFYEQFTTAGAGSTIFASNQEAFNAASDGLFYVEKELKDWKLGIPLGYVSECLSAPNTCPSDVESRYARVSTDHLRQNLLGFRRAFQGCGIDFWGLGFKDWLIEIGAGDLADEMQAKLEAAQAAVNALSPPLEEAIVTAPGNVATVHASVKALTDLLKTQFVTVLNLELPMGSEGDND